MQETACLLYMRWFQPQQSLFQGNMVAFGTGSGVLLKDPETGEWSGSMMDHIGTALIQGASLGKLLSFTKQYEGRPPIFFCLEMAEGGCWYEGVFVGDDIHLGIVRCKLTPVPEAFLEYPEEMDPEKIDFGEIFGESVISPNEDIRRCLSDDDFEGAEDPPW